MSLALVFSGQGTQHAGMLPWLDDTDPLLAQMAQMLGVDRWRQVLEDPARAARNHDVQLLLTGTGLAAWSALAPQLPTPAAVAGYSVGEVAAFSAAGVFDAGTALRLAAARAEAMDQAAATAPGGLLAVTGLAWPAIEAICQATALEVAIHIGADAAVIGGPGAALDAAMALASDQGARCTRLNIAVASHTSAMRPAAQAVAQLLDGLPLRAPTLPLFANATAERIRHAAQAASALSQQIAQTVLWANCLDALHARRPSCLLEIGPGSALAAMWNQRHPDVPARSADEFRHAGAAVDWVLRQQDR